MGRTKINAILQPDEQSCGPVSLKHALEILGKRKSVSSLTKLCKTSRNGTATKNMIKALNGLGYSVLAVERATLRHLISSLRYQPNKPRAVIVDYLYTLENTDEEPWWESGHWATVSSFSASNSKIVLFDGYSGTKKSYHWQDFRKRWVDYDLMKKKVSPRSKKFKSFRRWRKQLLLVVSASPKHLPKFRFSSTAVYPGVN